MKILKFFSFLFLILTSTYSNAQLVVNSSLTPQQLVQNVLLGSGVVASNITYTAPNGTNGSPNFVSMRSFNGINSNIGMASGIMLCTGKAISAIGPDVANPNGANTDFHTSGNDADLLAILPAGSGIQHDKAILEFDFVPQGDTAKFRYVFASEEYPDYVCSKTNDAFGFFISGPGIVGKQNIALIPGTNLGVSINTVNPGVAGQFANSTCSSLNYSSLYINNVGGQTVQYNGFTVPLTAKIKVTCGLTYHIKIIIADLGDGLIDSGVFLEAGSFSSIGATIEPISNSGDSSVIIEGCSDAKFKFNIPTAFASNKYIHYTIGGNALNGIDYSFIADSILIPAGQTFAYLPIQALEDGLTEGKDTITITVTSLGGCGSSSITTPMYIIDHLNLIISHSDQYITCPGQTVTLTPSVVGGISNKRIYKWDNGDSTLSITVSPLTTTKYVISVTDSCWGAAGIATDTITVFLPNYAPLTNTLTADTIIPCPSTTIPLIVKGFGGAGSTYSYSWNTVPAQTNDTIYVSPTSTTRYVVSITDSCGSTTINDTVNVFVPSFPKIFVTQDTIIEGCTTANFYFTRSAPLTDSLLITYSIGGSATNGTDYTAINDTLVFPAGVDTIAILINSLADGIAEGSDTINISIQYGQCAYQGLSASMYINDMIPLTLTTNDVTVNCPGQSVNISVAATGGRNNGLYHYTWADQPTVDNNTITVNPSITKTYYVSVSDSCAGPVIDSVVVTVPNNPLSVSITPSVRNIVRGCSGTQLSAQGSGGNGTGYTYTWTGGLNGASQFVNPTNTVTYVVTVQDSCQSQTATDTITVIVPNAVNAINSSASIFCPSSTVQITANANSGYGNYSYSWTNPAGQTTQTVSVNPATTTTYTFTVSDSCGFSDTGSVTVFVPGPFQPLQLAVTPTSDTSYCPGETATFTASASQGVLLGYQYAWNTNPITNGNTITVAPTNSATYTITVKDTCNNIKTKTVTVTVLQHPALVVDAGSDTTLMCPADSAILNAHISGGANQSITASWNNGLGSSASVLVIPGSTTTYTYTATDFCGNVASNSATITVGDLCDVEIPNVMTPNGDGHNDTFKIKGLENFPNSSLTLFNRWGTEIYSSGNYKNDWKGDNFSDGVFFYLLKYNGKEKKGTCSMLK